MAADAKKEANAIIQKACVEPLETAAGKKVPSVSVSSESLMNQRFIFPIEKYIDDSPERIRGYTLEFDSTYIRSR